METKTCTKCKAEKPLGEYHKHKRSKDGLHHRCKDCRRADKAEYNARPEVKARQTEYYAENRDKILAYHINYRAENRDTIRAYNAEYRKSSPHICSEGDYRKRMRGYGFEPRVSSFTMGELYERWGTRCYHCGSEDGTTLDHYPTPISRGGEHSLDNCRPSCMNCQRYSWREDFSPTRDEQD